MPRHPWFAVVVTVAVILVAALAGCATVTAGEPSAGRSDDPYRTPPSGPATASATTPRGAVAKDLGDPAGVCADEACAHDALIFTVDKIQVDPTCTEPYAEPPENGHYIAVSMSIETTTDFTDDLSFMVDFSPFSFDIVGPDGVTEPGDPGMGVYMCLRSSGFLPLEGLAPASRYVGVVVLDSRHTKGTLVLRMPGDPTGGWEWTF